VWSWFLTTVVGWSQLLLNWRCAAVLRAISPTYQWPSNCPLSTSAKAATATPTHWSHSANSAVSSLTFVSLVFSQEVITSLVEMSALCLLWRWHLYLLTWNRHRRSNNDCLEGTTWVALIRSVLCSIVCNNCAHIWTDLAVGCCLDLAFLWFYCVLQFICVRFSFLGLFCVTVYLCICTFYGCPA